MPAVHRRLFETLDPTLRQVRLPSGRAAILSDTVGFISDLPTPLIKAFQVRLSRNLVVYGSLSSESPSQQPALTLEATVFLLSLIHALHDLICIVPSQQSHARTSCMPCRQ